MNGALAKVDAARRRSREKEGEADVAEQTSRTTSIDDMSPILHQELERLPEKYRAPVVLCYLDGRTHEEAAAQLKWPLGTVKGRLTRARDVLRARLTRRGLHVSGGLMATVLGREAQGAVPQALLESTVKAAMGVAAGVCAAAMKGATSRNSERCERRAICTD